ncbi:GIY-YIG nuclease family protein [Chakrabartia godavariana]|nr:GIY-YIG nuclease family protein [Chakrabartia godavariana]
MGGFVYIMTNKPLGVLYVGVTSSLAERVMAHREGRGSVFCRQWDLRRLVYVEHHPTIEGAIAREKTLKKWKRVWKLRLIAKSNPNWDDLYQSINA